MRLLEALSLVLNLVAVTRALAVLRVPARWVNGVPFAAALVTFLHLALEGYRWQMLPAYGLTAALCAVSLWRVWRPALPPTAPRRARAVAQTALGVALVFLVALPPILFPVPRLPAPGGPHVIGTVAYDWTDPARDEIYGPPGKRQLMAQIWYPASPARSARTGPWMERLDVVGPAIARYLRLPSFVLDHAALVRTHAYPDAPVSDALPRYPVVVYSHGWNGFRTINTNQMEALASRGYVAVSLDHTYGALVTVFGDGRVVLNNPKALPRGAPEAEYKRATETLEGVYAADLRFVLDQLERLNAGELDQRFAGRLDLERVGLFGHSTGGGAVVIACGLDARCKAGLGMDAWVEPVPDKIVSQGLSQPFLFMRSEAWTNTPNDARLGKLYAGLERGGYRLAIRGTKHYDFVMLPLLTPLAPWLGLKGPIEGYRGMQIITDYLTAFFDQTLNGKPSLLLAGPPPRYAEVIFEKRDP